MYPDIRRSAFEKLAALAVQTPVGGGGQGRGIVEIAEQYLGREDVNGVISVNAKSFDSMVCIQYLTRKLIVLTFFRAFENWMFSCPYVRPPPQLRS